MINPFPPDTSEAFPTRGFRVGPMAPTRVGDSIARPDEAVATPLTQETRQRDGETVTTRVDRFAKAEEVVARHTALKPPERLSAIYFGEAIITGLPLLFVDVVTTAIALLTSFSIVLSTLGQSIGWGVGLQLTALLILQTLLMSAHHLYPGAGISPVAELRGIIRSSFLAMFCLSALNVLGGQLPRLEFVALALTALSVSAVLPLGRAIARKLLGKTPWWGLRVLVMGTHDDCQRTLKHLRRRRASGLVPAGYTCGEDEFRTHQGKDAWLLGRNRDAAQVAQRQMAPVAALASSQAELVGASDRLVFQFPSIVWLNSAGSGKQEIDASHLPDLVSTRLNLPFSRLAPRVCKRLVDLSICVPGLIVLAVPMAVLAIAIKCCSKGPVIYGSRRVGQHGREFKMWKFRSMIPDADEALRLRLKSDPVARREWEENSKLKSDPRIIPGIGHALRRYSLDELPQLWNVLVGDMSLVGPRPVPPNEIVRYQDRYYEYTQMWPGMTGLWQVSGRNDTNFETRVFLVHHYARNWSPWLDLWLLLQTPAAVFKRSGAY